MATAARRERWDHTASLAATMLNSRMGLKRHQMVNAIALHPMRQATVTKLHGEAARQRLRDVIA